MKYGIELIDAERERQITVEKFGNWHDDEHKDGSLRVVAAMLACIGTDAHVEDALDRTPWGLERHNEERRLVIAGALIAAEIDRLQRIKDYARQPEPTSQAEDTALRPAHAQTKSTP